MLLVAVAAVHWSSFFGLEGHFAVCSAVGALCWIHLAWAEIAAALVVITHILFHLIFFLFVQSNCFLFFGFVLIFQEKNLVPNFSKGKVKMLQKISNPETCLKNEKQYFFPLFIQTFTYFYSKLACYHKLGCSRYIYACKYGDWRSF